MITRQSLKGKEENAGSLLSEREGGTAGSFPLEVEKIGLSAGGKEERLLDFHETKEADGGKALGKRDQNGLFRQKW